MSGPEIGNEECESCDCSDCMRRDTPQNHDRLPVEELGCLSCTFCFEDRVFIRTENCEEVLPDNGCYFYRSKHRYDNK